MKIVEEKPVNLEDPNPLLVPAVTVIFTTNPEKIISIESVDDSVAGKQKVQDLIGLNGYQSDGSRYEIIRVQTEWRNNSHVTMTYIAKLPKKN